MLDPKTFSCFSTIVPNQSDDILLCCASFEGRSVAVIKNLYDYKVNNLIIFTLIDRTIHTSHEIELMKKHKDDIIMIAGPFAKKIFEIECFLSNPVDGLNKFTDLCSKYVIELRNKKVSFDISCFTKQYILILLKMLDIPEANNEIRILYSKTAEYNPRKLTEGIRHVKNVPFYNGTYFQDKENLLIIFLGFEKDRALAVWERYEPTYTIAVVGHPPYKEGWDKKSQRINRELLSRPNVRLVEMPMSPPIEIKNALERLYNQEYNIYIAPFGTKAQTIGIYLFVKAHPEVQIVYAIPQRYFGEYYSKGVSGFQEFYLSQYE